MLKRLLLSVVLAFFASAAMAQSPSCPQFYAQGIVPTIGSASLSPPSAERDFCFLGFGIAYSAQWREPIWSAEHITKESAQLALQVGRFGNFHVCDELADEEQSKNADYTGSGYQRGHMTPVGDFGDHDLENDTFRFCNMVPQTGNLNTKVWAGIEAAVLNWALTEDDVFVVTGPIVPAEPESIHQRVAVPSHTWKAVYSPKSGSSAYLCSNIDAPVCSIMSVDALARLTGVNPFPGLADAVTATLIALPQPTKGGPILN